MKACKDCPNPAKCMAEGKCMAAAPKMAKGGYTKKKPAAKPKMADGGYVSRVRANVEGTKDLVEKKYGRGSADKMSDSELEAKARKAGEQADRIRLRKRAADKEYGPAPNHVPGPDNKKKFTAQDIADVKERQKKPKMAKGGMMCGGMVKKAKKK